MVKVGHVVIQWTVSRLGRRQFCQAKSISQYLSYVKVQSERSLGTLYKQRFPVEFSRRKDLSRSLKVQ